MWKPDKFLVAQYNTAYEVRGHVYLGLGLHISKRGSPKGRRPPTWTLTHLGSGHAVCQIVGTVANAFPIATEIADCSDWDFDGLDGWRNRDPELPAKVAEIIARHPKQCSRNRGAPSSDAAARAVAMARAG